MAKYDFRRIEPKWQKKWFQDGVYEPDLNSAKKPFYNLMMFPYPSAEGLHVGNMYAFTGADIYGRKKRMEGYDVFEPIGLDGFGIHSENYALKIGTHPMDQSKVSEKRFYEQLRMIGNGFAWDERLETYDPKYYKWTQWIFIQLFKRGLAYRKKQAVNWCPKDKTVLADEQVIGGKCERCGSVVEKKELEQWFFRITKYAEKLLANLEKIDWSEKVKIAQRNWIGKSEGAEIDFEVKLPKGTNFVLIHGYKGSPDKNFMPWLKTCLERKGYKVQVPALPDSQNPNIEEQIEYVQNHVKFNKRSIVLGHSLGSVVALKAIEHLSHSVSGLVLVAGFSRKPSIRHHERDYEKTFNWEFDFKKIKSNAGNVIILRDLKDSIMPYEEADLLRVNVGGRIIDVVAKRDHLRGEEEPAVLEAFIPSIKVFTTRPDTLFGATYMVLSPEHKLIRELKSQITNFKEVEKYVGAAGKKSEEERIAEGKEKTGVELEGVKAINPANKEEIPIFVADYVLSSYGTAAIMAVPAHDERDFEFAKKFNLPIKMVICPNYPAPVCPVLDKAYEAEGYLVASGKFDGIPAEKAKWEITKFVHGERKIQYHLRDWLISRQRYWGVPIPMIHCEDCGWQPVPEKDLPVLLPYIKDFRPQGKGKSPLAAEKSFYETKCPKCGGKAHRETDVSDTFLDSAWYYLRYPSVTDEKEIFNPAVTKKWLPVDIYIGGFEHAVLHLLYVRFVSLALHDMGLLKVGDSRAPVGEPFPKFRAHGHVISKGAKMSKSKGNVVNPDAYIKEFGADTLRMYLMFLAPLEQPLVDFREEGISGISRFLERVWKLGQELGIKNNELERSDGELERLLHKTIKKVTEDIENLHYNTAISALMILLNAMEKDKDSLFLIHYSLFLKLLAPFASYITEELWQKLGNKNSIHKEKWPEYDPGLIKEEKIRLIIQINGKYRATINAAVGISQSEAENLAKTDEKVGALLTGQKIQKVIFVPDRLINFVV